MKHTKTTKEQRIKERLIACDAIRGRVYADIEHIQTQALHEHELYKLQNNIKYRWER